MGFLLRLIVMMIVVAGLTVAGVFGWMLWRDRMTAPQFEGALTLPGAPSTSIIARDEYGTPHLFGDQAGVYFALGVAHAQDRLFQMDLNRRRALGQASEVLGPSTLDSDVFARLIDRAGAAEATLNALPPDRRADFEHYAAGVNAVLTAPDFAPPPAFLRAGTPPRPWTARDSAAIVVQAFGPNLDAPLAAARAERIRAVLSPEQQAEFFPGYPLDWDPAVLAAAAGQGAEAFGSDAVRAAETPKVGGVSWAVDGAWTSSGLPLLATDLRTPMGAEDTYYLARVNGPQGRATGATIPGAPVVIAGHNGRAAWGLAPIAADWPQLVLEPVSGRLERRDETVLVRGEGPLTLRVRRAPSGPVADPPLLPLTPPTGQVAVLGGGLAQSVDGVIQTLAALNEGRSWAEVQQRIEGWDGAPMQIVYAEADPARPDDAGAVASSTLLPAELRPEAAQPTSAEDSGLILAAGAPPGFGANAVAGRYTPYHALRLRELLERTRLHDRDRFATIQTDAVSEQAERLLTAISLAAPQTPAGRVLRVILADWDARMDAAAFAPYGYSLWLAALPEQIWADELGAAFPLANHPRAVFLDRVLNGGLSAWCDDITTPARENCRAMSGRALDEAAATLAQRHRLETSDEETFLQSLRAAEDDLRWGATRPPAFPSQAGFDIPTPEFLRPSDTGLPGDDATLAGGAWMRLGLEDAQPGAVSVAPHAAPTFRAIFDLGDLDASLFITAPSQSERAPHLEDLAARWAAGHYVPVRSDWPLGGRPATVPLEEWVAEAAPPGSRILTLAPPTAGESG